MHVIEYRHHRTLKVDPWKSLRVAIRSQEDATQYIKNMKRLYGEDWEFRVTPCQVISNVKPLY